MSESYNTVEVAEELLRSLTGLNQVVLRTARGSRLSEAEHFSSLDVARPKIEAAILDAAVSNVWVGAQIELEDSLLTLLHDLNAKRGFGGISSANRVAKVLDLGCGDFL